MASVVLPHKTDRMPNTTDKWIDDLTDVRLPALGQSKRLLDDILDRPATGHADLAAIIGLDPGLSIQLFLELSRHPHQPAEPIIDPTRIISLLGITKVHEMAAKVPTLEDRYRGPALEGLRACYGRAILAARFALLLSNMRARRNSADSAMGALLQGLGEMALWSKRPATMKLLLADARRREDMEHASMRRFDARPSDLGASLARRWNLPDTLVRVQHTHNSMDGNVQLPILSAELAWAAFGSWRSDATKELMQLAADLVHLDPDIVGPALHKQAADAARLSFVRGLPNAAEGLMQIPKAAKVRRPRTEKSPVAPAAQVRVPQESSMPEQTQTQANPTALLPPPAAPRSRTESSRSEKPAVQPVEAVAESAVKGAQPRPQTAAGSNGKGAPKPAAEQNGAAPPVKPADPRKAARKAMLGKLDKLLRNMRDKAGMQRLMFAMLSQERKELRGRVVLEETASGLRDFKAPVDSRNLFALLLAKQNALWINSGNQVKYLPMIPQQTASLVSTRGFFVASIVAKNKPIGVIYGDADDLHLDADKFVIFQNYCQLVSKMFGGI